MAQKKRSPKRKSSPKKKRSEHRNGEPTEITRAMRSALGGAPKPARAILKRMDKFKRRHPDIYEVMTRDVDSPRYRAFELHLEQEQERKRNS